MKDRIKKYIEYKGISAGELAQKLEVQRSNISHILNGRNKPGAAFIEKMLLVYPDINARWLLTGVGDMVDKDESLDLFSQKDTIAETKKTVSEPKEIKEEAPKTESKKLVTEDSFDVKEVIATSDDVEKVVLLFKDGTFTSFKNRK